MNTTPTRFHRRHGSASGESTISQVRMTSACESSCSINDILEIGSWDNFGMRRGAQRVVDYGGLLWITRRVQFRSPTKWVENDYHWISRFVWTPVHTEPQDRGKPIPWPRELSSSSISDTRALPNNRAVPELRSSGTDVVSSRT